MATQAEELKYYFCHDHVENYENGFWKFHPGYRFNIYHIFPPKKCSYSNCGKAAYFESIGVQIPEYVPQVIEATKKAQKEIFDNAKQLLDNGIAIDRLTVFLKTKVIPQYKSYTADSILKHHARCILKKLKIDEKLPVSDKDKNRILIELDLYPVDNK